MEFDNFDDLMKRADPARSVVDQRTDAQIAHDVLKITGRPVVAPKTSRTWPWIVLPGAAVLALVIAVLIQAVYPTQVEGARAATPPPLAFENSPLSPKEVLERAMAQLQAGPVVESARHAELEGWYLQTEVDPAGKPNSVITPEEQLIDWNDDLSGSILATAGRTYIPQDGEEIVPPSGTGPAEGTVLRDDSFGPGQMPILFSAPPPTTAAEMKVYLASVTGLEPDADAMDYLDAVRILLSEWTLSTEQHTALLAVLADLPGFTTEGDVVDRLGRPGIGVRATTEDSPFASILIVSTQTGRILALETLYLGGLEELNVPPFSIIDYTAWK